MAAHSIRRTNLVVAKVSQVLASLLGVILSIIGAYSHTRDLIQFDTRVHSTKEPKSADWSFI
jgi:hypothetical protein